MSTVPKPRLIATVVVACLGVQFAPGARAQTAPDAGQILREQPKPAARPAARQPAPASPTAETPTLDGGPRLRVKAVKVTGATLVPAAELEAGLAALIGRDAGFDELQRAALQLNAAYAARGYLARVFLPPQDVVDGLVEFQVVEGRRGALGIDRLGTRIDAARVRAVIDRRLPPGAPMDVGALGEALNILNEQPGADVAVALTPGAAESAVDLRLSARDGPPVTYDATLNNQASRGVGTVQAIGSVTLNNPTGRFDAASLLLSAAEGSAYLRGDYGLAVGDGGGRVKLHAGHLAYRLVQQSLRPLEARGTARTLGLSTSLPLVRRSERSATLSAGIEHKRLVDETVAGETGNRVVRVATLGIGGSLAPVDGGRIGELDYGAVLTAGRSDQRQADARAADLAGRHTQGGFAKLGLNAGWRQGFGGDWVLSAVGRGQWADRNLDSSEQFFLGGVGGVRAYPTGEAVGDEGWLLSVDLARQVGDRLLVGAFVDGGEVRLNHTLPPGAGATRNRYGLAGAGVSLDWLPRARTALRVMLAAPLGHNPAAAASGNDADSRRSGGARLWASLTARF